MSEIYGMGEITDQIVDGFARAAEALVKVGGQGRRKREQEIVGPDNILASTLTEEQNTEIGRLVEAGELEEVSMVGFFVEPLAGSPEQLAKHLAIRRSIHNKIDTRLGKQLAEFTADEDWWLSIEDFMAPHWIYHDGGDSIRSAVITESRGVEVIHESDLGLI